MSKELKHYSEHRHYVQRNAGSYMHAFMQWPPVPDDVGPEAFIEAGAEAWRHFAAILDGGKGWQDLQAHASWLASQIEAIEEVFRLNADSAIDNGHERLANHPGIIAGIDADLADRLAYHQRVFGVRLRTIQRLSNTYMATLTVPAEAPADFAVERKIYEVDKERGKMIWHDSATALAHVIRAIEMPEVSINEHATRIRKVRAVVEYDNWGDSGKGDGVYGALTQLGKKDSDRSPRITDEERDRAAREIEGLVSIS